MRPALARMGSGDDLMDPAASISPLSAVSRRFHTVDGTLRKLLQERCWQQRLQLRIIRAMVAVDDQVVAAGSEENINTYS